MPPVPIVNGQPVGFRFISLFKHHLLATSRNAWLAIDLMDVRRHIFISKLLYASRIYWYDDINSWISVSGAP